MNVLRFSIVNLIITITPSDMTGTFHLERSIKCSLTTSTKIENTFLPIDEVLLYCAGMNGCNCEMAEDYGYRGRICTRRHSDSDYTLFVSTVRTGDCKGME